MSEFRQNPATKEWVIIATERARRPEDFTPAHECTAQPPEQEYDPDCPFCPGNERMAADPTYVDADAGSWKVRAVRNKYAALDRETEPRRVPRGNFLSATGYGVAEVVIETPVHNLPLHSRSQDDIFRYVKALKARQLAISHFPDISHVTIFKNHGPRAGTSLVHPHSQIIATPIIPPHVRDPFQKAMQHYDTYGSCVYCDLMEEELRQQERVVVENEHFVAFCPFASRSPFETRIYPRRHIPGFHWTANNELESFAAILREITGRIHTALDNPDYNFIIRSAPVGDEDVRYLHWYFILIPKVTTPAGFEIGTGIYINVVPPEDAAERLRNISG